MFSLYVHIPFCEHKCKYCSFHVIPKHNDEQQPHTFMDNLVTEYHSGLLQEISKRHSIYPDEQIKTLYFGGGTPSCMGKERLCKIIDHVGSLRGFEYLEELSIELNPHPHDEITDLITTLNERYKKFPRIRFSIGVQSLDNEVLADSGREYTYSGLVDFLRALPPLKTDINVFNFDFIAFGKFNKTRSGNSILRDTKKQEFFETFIESGFADGFSLYTLELFEGSRRYQEQIHHASHAKDGFGLKKYGNDNDVYDEFALLKAMILDGGYRRYELSNFSGAGKNSIHNRVYRNMENYIGVGTSAASFLSGEMLEGMKNDAVLGKNMNDKTVAMRRTNTKVIADYIKGSTVDEKEMQPLTQYDLAVEAAFLGLRTDRGMMVNEDVMSDNRRTVVTDYEQQGLLTFDGEKIMLTDEGMDVYNTIVTDLLEFGEE